MFRSKLSHLVPAFAIAWILLISGCGGQGAPVVRADRTVVDIASNDLAYDGIRHRIWSTVGNVGSYANSIVAIDPATGDITDSIPTDGEPNLLAVTDNGLYAYVSIPADHTVKRIDLNRGVVTLTVYVGDLLSLCTVPGSPQTFLAGGNPIGGVNVKAYDDDVPRANTGAGGYYIKMASPTVMYGNGDASLFTCLLEPGAINWTSQKMNLITNDFDIFKGFLVDADGHVVNPISMTVYGQLPTTHFLPNGRHVACSVADNRAYIITWDAVINKQLLCYDMSTLTELPQRDTGSIPGGAVDMVACGNHTVAFRDFGAIVEPNKVYIFRNLP